MDCAPGPSDATHQTVILHQFPPCSGDTLSASPFCAKVEVFCKLHGIALTVRNGADVHPKTKKMPWIEFTSAAGVRTIVADSAAILDFLAREFNIATPLSAADAATAHLLTRTLDEHVYWTTVRTRWLSGGSPAFLAKNYFSGAPEFVASFIVWLAGMRGNVWAQGTGRFSEAEVLARLETDCAAISTLLAGREEGRFLFNSRMPSSADAVLFAHMNAVLKVWEGNWARSPLTATGPILAYLADVKTALRM